MTGTDVTIAGTQVPAKNGAIVLSAEARSRLNSLGEAWTEAQWQLVTYSPARDDTWAEKVIKDLSGAKLEIDKVTQGYQSVIQLDQQAELKRKAMDAFIETTLRRIELIAIEAPGDASSILLAWMNRLASRVADLADQASKLTTAHKNMLDKVDALRSEKGSATAVSAKLEKGIEQMERLLRRITNQQQEPSTPPSGDFDPRHGVLSEIDQKTDEAIGLLRRESEFAHGTLRDAEERAAAAVQNAVTAAIETQLAQAIADALEAELQGRLDVAQAVDDAIKATIPANVRGQWTKTKNKQQKAAKKRKGK